MSQHDGIVVHVDDPGLRRDGLGYLMGVLSGRQPGADIQELPDPCFPGEELDGPAQECPVGPDTRQDVRVVPDGKLTGFPVGFVVVLATEPVVIDPGRVSHGDVERRRFSRTARKVAVLRA